MGAVDGWPRFPWGARPNKTPPDGQNIAGTLCRVVRRAGVDAAAASACHAGGSTRRRKRAADCTDGGRQDAGGIPAHAGGPRRGAACRHPYAVCQPAEGAGHRHCAQSVAAGRGNAACHLDRDSHRRHTGQPPGPPARQSPQHPADDAGEPGGAAVAAGRAGDVRRTVHPGDGRSACAGRDQARRPVGAVRGAADGAGAALPARRAIGNGRASGGNSGLRGRRTADRGTRRRAA